MSVSKVESVINGEVVTLSGETQDLINPTTGQVFAQSPIGTAKDVDEAYKSAAAGFKVWRDSTPA